MGRGDVIRRYRNTNYISLGQTPHGSQTVVSDRFRRFLTVSTRTLLSIACPEKTPLITQRSLVQIQPPQPNLSTTYEDSVTPTNSQKLPIRKITLQALAATGLSTISTIFPFASLFDEAIARP